MGTESADLRDLAKGVAQGIRRELGREYPGGIYAIVQKTRDGRLSLVKLSPHLAELNQFLRDTQRADVGKVDWVSPGERYRQEPQEDKGGILHASLYLAREKVYWDLIHVPMNWGSDRGLIRLAYLISEALNAASPEATFSKEVLSV